MDRFREILPSVRRRAAVAKTVICRCGGLLVEVATCRVVSTGVSLAFDSTDTPSFAAEAKMLANVFFRFNSF